VGEINFSSFPRSGNHFTKDLINNCLPKIVLNWDGHHSASFFNNKKNCFTVIRKPEDCIASWIIYNRDTREERIDKVTEWYIAFYKQCINNNITVVNFSNLITEPIIILNFLCNIFNIENKNLHKYDLSKLDKNATKITRKKEVEKVKFDVMNSKFYLQATDIFEDLSNSTRKPVLIPSY